MWNLSHGELHTLKVTNAQDDAVQRQAWQPETGGEPDARPWGWVWPSHPNSGMLRSWGKNEALKVLTLKILEMHAEWKKPAAKRWTLHVIYLCKGEGNPELCLQ